MVTTVRGRGSKQRQADLWLRFVCKLANRSQSGVFAADATKFPRFTGKERDSESGLDYFGQGTTGARWGVYQPGYTQPDADKAEFNRGWIAGRGREQFFSRLS